MKKSIFLSIVMSVLMALPMTAFAQRFFASIPLIPTRQGGISLGINIGCPGPNYVWIDGYWDWDDYYGDYVWVDGTWALPPRQGWSWTNGYWECGSDGYVWISGYWSNPYRPKSYFGATHRNGGGCAPYFIRDHYDRGRYSSVFVSGNRRYDNNYYYSGRSNSGDRRNYAGSYDRARRENRDYAYSREMNRGNDRNSFGFGRNNDRGNNNGERFEDNRSNRNSFGNGQPNRDNQGYRGGNYDNNRSASDRTSYGRSNQQMNGGQPARRGSNQDYSNARNSGVSNNPQGGNRGGGGWRFASDQASPRSSSTNAPQREAGRSESVGRRESNSGNQSTRSSAENSRNGGSSRTDRSSNEGGRR